MMSGRSAQKASGAPVAVSPRGGVDQPATGAGTRAGVESELAAEIQQLVIAGRWHEARERYADLVARHQRRAVRLACYYLRDGAEADEAVQDAFVKAFSHLTSFDRTRSFEVWFTRILVNSCLDRVKARKRRLRWQVALGDTAAQEPVATTPAGAAGASPEATMLRRERARQLLVAIRQLPTRQRTVIMLSHLDGRTTREVSEVTGLSESTVRVHLFRGLRKLRTLVTRAQDVR
jgi:RNA polymerase sigma-70 factor (ECF subfamily)